MWYVVCGRWGKNRSQPSTATCELMTKLVCGRWWVVKILNRGNEPKILLKIKGLTFLEAQKRTEF